MTAENETILLTFGYEEENFQNSKTVNKIREINRKLRVCTDIRSQFLWFLCKNSWFKTKNFGLNRGSRSSACDFQPLSYIANWNFGRMGEQATGASQGQVSVVLGLGHKILYYWPTDACTKFQSSMFKAAEKCVTHGWWEDRVNGWMGWLTITRP